LKEINKYDKEIENKENEKLFPYKKALMELEKLNISNNPQKKVLFFFY
jgi:hypothetical protein